MINLNIKHKDKLLHYLVGFTITAIATPISIVLSVVALLVAAVGKEVLDYYFDGTVDYLDIVATVIGGVVPIAIYLLVR